MKISQSTIVRTIILALVLINFVLERCGVDIIKTDENQIVAAVEVIIDISVIVAAWWYNNSFSQKALRAQRFLEQLKEEDE